MLPTVVHTLDLKFQGQPGTIAAYLLPHSNGAILIETGPGSTIPNLLDELEKYGFKPSEITDVFLTHIHLDHAGASGWLADQGAMIHVHPQGMPHLANPEKLLASAFRIYGDQMEYLWGMLSPVREDHLLMTSDGETIQCAGLQIKTIDTPGHAYHHNAYIVDDICFSGDIGGVRVHGLRYLSLPTPPPEFHLELWRETIQKLRNEHPSRIAPTHFGIYNDAEWHLAELSRMLDNIEAWMEHVMPSGPPIETLRAMFIDFEMKRAREAGLEEGDTLALQIANPSFMSADGMLRYWKKHRLKTD